MLSLCSTCAAGARALRSCKATSGNPNRNERRLCEREMLGVDGGRPSRNPNILNSHCAYLVFHVRQPPFNAGNGFKDPLLCRPGSGQGPGPEGNCDSRKLITNMFRLLSIEGRRADNHPQVSKYFRLISARLDRTHFCNTFSPRSVKSADPH